MLWVVQQRELPVPGILFLVKQPDCLYFVTDWVPHNDPSPGGVYIEIWILGRSGLGLRFFIYQPLVCDFLFHLLLYPVFNGIC